jgi:hypothetical protein
LMQFQLHRYLPQDPDRGRSRRKNHNASRRRQAVHRRDHRSSRGWRLSDRPPLCRWSVPPRNRDPSPFFSCAAAARPGPDTAVADPRVSARHAESFGSGLGPLAYTPADCSRRSSSRSTLVRGHIGGTRRFAGRNAGNRTSEPLPAPPTGPPTGRWTAPGRAGIKAMLNGSPQSFPYGRGPGVRWPIERPGPSFILTQAHRGAYAGAQTPQHSSETSRRG